jgi:hypothetical protein
MPLLFRTAYAFYIKGWYGFFHALENRISDS